jgi:Ca2+-binding RTX toxin-like protein
MLTKINQVHMDQISAMRIQAENGQIGYWKIYQTLAILLQSDYGYEATNPTVLWLRGATEANAGRGSMSELIRVYSSTQAMLRYGETVSESKMQEASNEVAKNLLKYLFDEVNDNEDTYAIIPKIEDIADKDATAVGKILFNRDSNDTAASEEANSAWSGTLLFTQLTSDQSYRLMSKGDNPLAVDSLNDWRDVLYAYVSYEAGFKAARAKFLLENSIQQSTDQAILGDTFYGYVTGDKTLIDYISTLVMGVDNQGLLLSFQMIQYIGVNRFLDMLMGAVLGKPIIGTTNDDNFFINAKTFFQSSILDLATQSLNKFSLSELILLAKTDVNVLSALNALSLVSVETSSAVQSKFVLYNSATEQGEITEQWIEDRANALLTLKNYWFTGTTIGSPLPDQNWVIEDLSTGIKVVKGGSNLSATQNSFIFGTDGDDINIRGGNGKDHIYGGRGNNELYGGKGDDYLEGGIGSDELHGGDDHDKLVGMNGIDYLYGEDGNDILFGGAENDELYGGDGNDYLNGGSGDDYLDGGTGNDILVGGKGWLKTAGGDGNDIIFADQINTSNLVDELNGGNGNDILYGYDGKNKIDGGDGNDLLYGGNDTNEIKGGEGNDLIYAGIDNDILEGGTGTNIIVGNGGTDTYRFFTSAIGLDGFGTTLIKDNAGNIIIDNKTLQLGEYDPTIRAWRSQDGEYIIRKLGEDTDKKIISIHKEGDEKNTIYLDGWEQDFPALPAENIPSIDGVLTLNDGSNIIYNQNKVSTGGGNDYIATNNNDNYVDGGDGNNWIDAGGGDDYVVGGKDDDIILTGYGDDVVYGGMGDDLIFTTVAHGSLNPYFFNDNLKNGYSTSVYYLDYDIDFKYQKKISEETQSYSVYVGDTVTIMPNIQTYIIIEGKQIDLFSALFLDQDIRSGEENDQDTVYGGQGLDFIIGSGSVDRLYGGQDDDHLYGRGGDDYIYGDQGEDNIYGGAGRDYLNGGDNNDNLVGGYEADIVFGGQGDDVITGDLNNLFGTDAPPASADPGRYGDDLIYGGVGEDKIWGNGGNDILYGGDDKDQIDGGDGDDFLFGGNGNDSLVGGANNDILFGDDNDDFLKGEDGDDILYGGDGNDIFLFGGRNNDIIYGGAGKDALFGEDGNDILFGGVGDDQLIGGQGSDLYVFSIGDGKDTIKEEVTDLASLNYQNFIYFTFDPNLTRDVSRDGLDLIIQYGIDDQVTVKDYYKVRNTSNNSYLENQELFEQIEISEVRFEDGTVWNTAKIMEMAPPPDVLELPPEASESVAYFIDALATRENIVIQGKITLTYSFPANDLSGSKGYTDEQIIAIEQALNKFAEVLNITFIKSETGVGDLKFYLDDLTSADAGAAAGYASAQTGEVHINSSIFKSSDALNAGNYGFEVLLHEIGHAFGLEHPFEAPVLPELENIQNNTVMSYTSNGLNDTELKFYDIAALQYLHGVNKNIRAENNIYTFADKYIWDGNGIDTLDASVENQNVFINLNEGSWNYIGQKESSILSQGQSFIGYGTTIENAIGGSGDDTLVSNEANNTLQGGFGQDVYIFNGDFGRDKVVEVDAENTLVLNIDQTLGLYYLNEFLHNGDNQVELNIEKFSKIILNGIELTRQQFKDNYLFSAVYEGGVLDDNIVGAVILNQNGAQLTGNNKDNIIYGNVGFDYIYGEEGDDDIYGGAENDELYGGDGSDKLSGGDGSDILNGGSGSDILIGGAGNDTYIFSVDDGVDYIKDTDSTRIVFSEVQSKNILIEKEGVTLTINYSDKDKVIFNNYADNINEIIFSNESWNYENVKLNIFNVTKGSTGDDSFSGYMKVNTILRGEDGNDLFDFFKISNSFLYGGEGNDQFVIDTGGYQYNNVRVEGGLGYDIYDISNGDWGIVNGVTISDEDGLGKIYMNYSVIWANVHGMSGSLDDTRLDAKYDYSSKTITYYYFGDEVFSLNNINNINDISRIGNLDISIDGASYGSGIVYGPTEAKLLRLMKGTSTEFLYTNSDDIIDDLIVSHLSNRVYALGGDDQISIESNDYYIYGGDGNDSITINTGIAYGDEGNDNLFGSGQLYGGIGSDTLIANNDGAYMDGGEGADILQGSSGDDTYIIDELDTLQLESETGGYDTIIYQYDIGNVDLANSQFEAIELFGSSHSDLLGNIANNRLIGNEGNNYIDGRAGSDYMAGGQGNDYYVVDVSDVLATDQDGNTYIIEGDQVVEEFDSGIDTIERWQDARLIGQDSNGDSVLTNNHRLLEENIENLILKGSAKTAFGNGLDNIIVGNELDNFINGLAGDDTYIYKKGGGTDTFSFEDELSAVNILKIEGHEASSLYAQKFGESVLIGFRNSTDRIWLSNYNLADYQDSENTTFSNKFDQIVFDSGEIWTTSEIDSLLLRAENNQAPVIQQYPSTLNVKIEEVLQYTFSNIITDPDADDQLNFKLTLQTQDGSGEYQDIPEWIIFDPLTLTITVSPPEGVDAGQLNFYLWGTDLYGVGTGVGVNINIQPSANTPIPGAIYDTLGNDSLIGGDEDNIFFYTGGKDVLQEAGGLDVLRFSNGITFNQVGSGLMKSGNDLILKVNGSSANQITLKNYFLAGNNLVETIDFETGGQLTAEQIFGAFGLTIPTTGGGTQPANPVGDTIYSYTAGELTINEQSGTDKVIFKNGITFSQVGNYLSKSGDDLVLKVNGSNTNKVTVKNFFLAGNSLVENFEFETGGALTAQQIFDAFGLTLPSTGGSGNQGSSEVVGDTTYNYTSGALTITEQSGNDKVIFKNGITFNQVGSYLTKSGDDLILKVNGSNTNKVTVKNFFLAGQYLVETFQFETGGQITAEQIFGAFGITMPQQSMLVNTLPENTDLDAFNTSYNYSSGAMVIDEKLGTDQVVFGNGITFSQVANNLTKSGDDLILKVNGSNSDKITVKDYFLGGTHEIESFNFETGGSISSQQIYQVFGVDRPVNAEDEVTSIVMGDSGDNVLSSDVAVSELFVLGEGNDILELLLNASGETPVDFVTDFNMTEDQIDLSQILDNHANSSNLSDYIEIIYDTNAKTNTLSARNQPTELSKDLLIFTNQADSLSIADLTMNQSIIY